MGADRLGEGARKALSGTRFADVRWVSETGSTNADILSLARDGEPEGIVCVADHQTAGRGRHGREWTAPVAASLLCTVLLRPPAAVELGHHGGGGGDGGSAASRWPGSLPG